MRRRSNFPEFLEFVQRFDLRCFSETKIDETDVISFLGYDSIDQPRKQPFLRKPGGIARPQESQLKLEFLGVPYNQTFDFITGQFVKILTPACS